MSEFMWVDVDSTLFAEIVVNSPDAVSSNMVSFAAIKQVIRFSFSLT
jgi:hypothetical protein